MQREARKGNGTAMGAEPGNFICALEVISICTHGLLLISERTPIRFV